MQWNDQGCLVGGMTTVGGRIATCVRLLQLGAWLQQADHLHYITMQISASWVHLLFCIILVFNV